MYNSVWFLCQRITKAHVVFLVIADVVKQTNVLPKQTNIVLQAAKTQANSPRQPARSSFLTNAVPFTPVPCGFGVVCILDDAWVCMHPSLLILSTFSTPQFSQHRAHIRYYFYFCPLVSSPLSSTQQTLSRLVICRAFPQIRSNGYRPP